MSDDYLGRSVYPLLFFKVWNRWHLFIVRRLNEGEGELPSALPRVSHEERAAVGGGRAKFKANLMGVVCSHSKSSPLMCHLSQERGWRERKTSEWKTRKVVISLVPRRKEDLCFVSLVKREEETSPSDQVFLTNRFVCFARVYSPSIFKLWEASRPIGRFGCVFKNRLKELEGGSSGCGCFFDWDMSTCVDWDMMTWVLVLV